MRRLVMVLMLVAGAYWLEGCGQSCSSGSTCGKGGTWQACCTSTSCEYKTSDGTVFQCAGTDCASGNPSAAQQVANWCLSH